MQPGSSHSSTRRTAATWILVIGAGACNDSPSSPTMTPHLSTVNESEFDVQDLFLGEADFVTLSEAQPSFAGFYFENGTLVVTTTDRTRGADIHAAIQERATELISLRPEQLTGLLDLRQVAYSFIELSRWRNLAFTHVLGHKDVASLDLDETRNRVSIDLKDGSGETGFAGHSNRCGTARSDGPERTFEGAARSESAC